MRILSIETSCDETAISIVEANSHTNNSHKMFEFNVLGNALLSQIDLHKEYGGVFPALAKREHAKNLIPLLKKILEESGFLKLSKSSVQDSKFQILDSILEREPELLKQFLEFIPTIKIPEIDAIAVTNGPGLEPALWVGINFAKALSLVWNKPIIPVNHMEGHIVAALLKEKSSDDKSSTRLSTGRVFDFQFSNIAFPMLALLISGGHTQLVLSKEWLQYEIIGETLDDAVGEAFDKVARMLGLPYPGGPEISKLVEKVGHTTQNQSDFKFPRPMIHSNTCDFSFSGLKTSILYTLKKIPDLTDDIKQKIAKEFEDAVIETLTSKTKKALEESGAQTLVIGGGVSANKNIQIAFKHMIENEFPNLTLSTPEAWLSTDNAIMIAVAGYFRFIKSPEKYDNHILGIKAEGNLSL